ncbi:inorganic phosphate transporter [Gorillibacterium massiliense]|uniref:inorganic phosphate transporter n=1 Tax=Gorillibacterium massiliense TaxID=1280390 RepID=UPI0004B93236|nr:inorganic phosphate transporter [Gorillibacterium massiliense]
MTAIIIIVFLALAFDFINGFHDTANAIATSVSTKALRPRFAIFYAAVLNFLGALLFEGVAKNIGGNIADPFKIPHGTHIIIAALISMILWNLLTWYFGIPSSSSHTLIGSLVGTVVAGAGFDAVTWHGFTKILLVLVLSPVIAFIAGYIVLHLIRFILKLVGKTSPGKINRGFRFLQIFSAGWQAFSHGTNDAQKAMGIIVFALVSQGYLTEMHVPIWVKLAAASSMALGTSVGGWKIIKTVGQKIVKVEPMNGFASDLTASTVLTVATHFGMPLSTTHVITSSIVGTGTALRPRSINWGIVRQMVLTWVITIPISMVIGYVIYQLIFGLFA